MSHVYTIYEKIVPLVITFTDFYTKQKQINKIIWVHNNYIIEKYDIVVDNNIDNKLEDIIIYNAFHPNAYIPAAKGISTINRVYKRSELCVSEEFKGIIINEVSLKCLKWILLSWNLDSAHRWPDLSEKYIRYQGKRLPYKNPFGRR